MNPQMYPLNWILMFIYFSFMFYCFLSFTYFFLSPKLMFSKKLNLIYVTKNCWKNCW